MQFSIALEDDLAEALCKFKNNETFDSKLIEKIFHYYKTPVLMNKTYILEYYKDSSILTSILSSSSHINFQYCLKCLALKYTKYKVILSSTKNDFPYVNINKDKIENNFTATFIKLEIREKAKQHIRSLIYTANEIIIYDKYICKYNTSLIKFFKECFPQKSLKINFHPDCNITQEQISLLKQQCSLWKILILNDSSKIIRYKKLHDRYLVIDNKIELIFTSGIDNLMDDSKDFTYIIRELSI